MHSSIAVSAQVFACVVFVLLLTFSSDSVAQQEDAGVVRRLVLRESRPFSLSYIEPNTSTLIIENSRPSHVRFYDLIGFNQSDITSQQQQQQLQTTTKTVIIIRNCTIPLLQLAGDLERVDIVIEESRFFSITALSAANWTNVSLTVRNCTFDAASVYALALEQNASTGGEAFSNVGKKLSDNDDGDAGGGGVPKKSLAGIKVARKTLHSVIVTLEHNDFSTPFHSEELGASRLDRGFVHLLLGVNGDVFVGISHNTIVALENTYQSSLIRFAFQRQLYEKHSNDDGLVADDFNISAQVSGNDLKMVKVPLIIPGMFIGQVQHPCNVRGIWTSLFRKQVVPPVITGGGGGGFPSSSSSSSSSLGSLLVENNSVDVTVYIPPGSTAAQLRGDLWLIEVELDRVNYYELIAVRNNNVRSNLFNDLQFAGNLELFYQGSDERPKRYYQWGIFVQFQTSLRHTHIGSVDVSGNNVGISFASGALGVWIEIYYQTSLDYVGSITIDRNSIYIGKVMDASMLRIARRVFNGSDLSLVGINHVDKISISNNRGWTPRTRFWNERYSSDAAARKRLAELRTSVEAILLSAGGNKKYFAPFLQNIKLIELSNNDFNVTSEMQMYVIKVQLYLSSNVDRLSILNNRILSQLATYSANADSGSAFGIGILSQAHDCGVFEVSSNVVGIFGDGDVQDGSTGASYDVVAQVSFGSSSSSASSFFAEPPPLNSIFSFAAGARADTLVSPVLIWVENTMMYNISSIVIRDNELISAGIAITKPFATSSSIFFLCEPPLDAIGSFEISGNKLYAATNYCPPYQCSSVTLFATNISRTSVFNVSANEIQVVGPELIHGVILRAIQANQSGIFESAKIVYSPPPVRAFIEAPSPSFLECNFFIVRHNRFKLMLISSGAAAKVKQGEHLAFVRIAGGIFRGWGRSGSSSSAADGGGDELAGGGVPVGLFDMSENLLSAIAVKSAAVSSSEYNKVPSSIPPVRVTAAQFAYISSENPMTSPMFAGMTIMVYLKSNISDFYFQNVKCDNNELGFDVSALPARRSVASSEGGGYPPHRVAIVDVDGNRSSFASLSVLRPLVVFRGNPSFADSVDISVLTLRARTSVIAGQTQQRQQSSEEETPGETEIKTKCITEQSAQQQYDGKKYLGTSPSSSAVDPLVITAQPEFRRVDLDCHFTPTRSRSVQQTQTGNVSTATLSKEQSISHTATFHPEPPPPVAITPPQRAAMVTIGIVSGASGTVNMARRALGLYRLASCGGDEEDLVLVAAPTSASFSSAPAAGSNASSTATSGTPQQQQEQGTSDSEAVLEKKRIPVDELEFDENPFMMKIGDDELATHRGVQIGNLLFVVLWLGAMVLIAFARKKMYDDEYKKKYGEEAGATSSSSSSDDDEDDDSNNSSEDSGETTQRAQKKPPKRRVSIWSFLQDIHFPGLGIVPINILGPPTVGAACLVAFGRSKRSTASTGLDNFVVVVGMVFFFVVPLVVFAWVSHRVLKGDGPACPPLVLETREQIEAEEKKRKRERRKQKEKERREREEAANPQRLKQNTKKNKKTKQQQQQQAHDEDDDYYDFEDDSASEDENDETFVLTTPGGVAAPNKTKQYAGRRSGSAMMSLMTSSSSSSKQLDTTSKFYRLVVWPWLFLMQPRQEWRETDFVEKYGLIFDSYVTPLFALVEYLSVTFIAIFANASQLCTSKSCCYSWSSLCLITTVCYLGGIVWRRPYTNRFDSWFILLTAMFLVVISSVILCVLTGAGNGDELQQGLLGLVRTVFWMSMICAVVYLLDVVVIPVVLWSRRKIIETQKRRRLALDRYFASSSAVDAPAAIAGGGGDGKKNTVLKPTARQLDEMLLLHQQDGDEEHNRERINSRYRGGRMPLYPRPGYVPPSAPSSQTSGKKNSNKKLGGKKRGASDVSSPAFSSGSAAAAASGAGDYLYDDDEEEMSSRPNFSRQHHHSDLVSNYSLPSSASALWRRQEQQQQQQQHQHQTNRQQQQPDSVFQNLNDLPEYHDDDEDADDDDTDDHYDEADVSGTHRSSSASSASQSNFPINQGMPDTASLSSNVAAAAAFTPLPFGSMNDKSSVVARFEELRRHKSGNANNNRSLTQESQSPKPKPKKKKGAVELLPVGYPTAEPQQQQQPMFSSPVMPMMPRADDAPSPSPSRHSTAGSTLLQSASPLSSAVVAPSPPAPLRSSPARSVVSAVPLSLSSRSAVAQQQQQHHQQQQQHLQQRRDTSFSEAALQRGAEIIVRARGLAAPSSSSPAAPAPTAGAAVSSSGGARKRPQPEQGRGSVAADQPRVSFQDGNDRHHAAQDQTAREDKKKNRHLLL